MRSSAQRSKGGSSHASSADAARLSVSEDAPAIPSASSVAAAGAGSLPHHGAGHMSAGDHGESAPSSADDIFNKIALLESQVAAEKARADAFEERYWAEVRAREELEARIHASWVAVLTRPFRVCFG